MSNSSNNNFLNVLLLIGILVIGSIYALQVKEEHPQLLQFIPDKNKINSFFQKIKFPLNFKTLKTLNFKEKKSSLKIKETNNKINLKSKFFKRNNLKKREFSSFNNIKNIENKIEINYKSLIPYPRLLKASLKERKDFNLNNNIATPNLEVSFTTDYYLYKDIIAWQIDKFKLLNFKSEILINEYDLGRKIVIEAQDEFNRQIFLSVKPDLHENKSFWLIQIYE